ncbi:hypothetical protein CYY_004853 [Polysphondylium violaceum]|uniref:ABC transporter B family protein n=1 Tax=Polysphondylium violaceum TaxID=133409 RepID=A0A8J4Q4K8_9MYCE|nr:hypothetical protein CYY_004853 [Polysphondylium violaceum]
MSIRGDKNYNYLDEEEDYDDGSPSSQTPMGVLKKKPKKNVKFNLQTFSNNSDNINNNSNSNSSSSSHSIGSKKITDSFHDENDMDFYDDDDDLFSNIFDDESFHKANYSTRRCVFRIISYLRPQFWYFMLAFLSLAVTTACQLSLPFYFASGIQDTIEGNAINRFNSSLLNNTGSTTSSGEYHDDIKIDLDDDIIHNFIYSFQWFSLSKSLMIIIIIQTPFLFTRYLFFTLAGNSFVSKLKTDLFKSLLTQEVSYFDSNRAGDLKAVISSDPLIIQNCITVALSTLIRCSLQSMGGSLILVFISWKVTLVLASFLVILFFGFSLFKTIINPRHQYFEAKHVNVSQILDNSIQNIREIRLLNAETRELRSFETEIESIYRSNRSFISLSAFWIAIGSLIMMVLSVVVYLFAVKQTLSSNIMLLQYILYALMVTSSMSGLITSLNEIQRVVSSARRVFSLIDRKPAVNFQGGIQPSTDIDDIQFENVSFHHKNGAVLLSDLSFNVSKGQMIALVGPSMSKEIIFSLIQGIYYPTRGSVLIGRIDTKVLDLFYFRNRLFSITSNTVIFNGTVEQNIRYGLANHLCSPQNVIDAAKMANIHDFIIALPNGYDTMLGQDKVLNNQHIQKIAIARAFLRNPSVLLIDETSCVMESDQGINQCLDKLFENRTVLVIPHRHSTLSKCNQILVFEESRIVEKGTHNDLISKSNGFYKNIVQQQFSK